MSQKGFPFQVTDARAGREKVVLLLTIDSEGIRSTLKATGQRYILKAIRVTCAKLGENSFPVRPL